MSDDTELVTLRFSPEQAIQRWRECGYEVSLFEGESEPYRAELRRGGPESTPVAAAEGESHVMALARATFQELARLPLELRALWAAGFEVED